MTIDAAKRKLVALARAQIGYREGPSNYNKFADDARITKLYGWNPQNQPWCCVFVNWCFINAFGYDVGSGLTFGGTAACSNSAQLFRQHGSFASSPEVGDQIFFYSGGGINHTGIVVGVSGGSVTTVEGNYSDGVGTATYPIGSAKIAGYGRPMWAMVQRLPDEDSSGSDSPAPVSGTDTSPPEDPDPSAKEECQAILPKLRLGDEGVAVERLQTLLIARGYYCGGRLYGGREHPDGEFGPATEVALKDAQMAAGITQDGVVGSGTWSALINT